MFDGIHCGTQLRQSFCVYVHIYIYNHNEKNTKTDQHSNNVKKQTPRKKKKHRSVCFLRKKTVQMRISQFNFSQSNISIPNTWFLGFTLQVFLGRCKLKKWGADKPLCLQTPVTNHLLLPLDDTPLAIFTKVEHPHPTYSLMCGSRAEVMGQGKHY